MDPGLGLVTVTVAKAGTANNAKRASTEGKVFMACFPFREPDCKFGVLGRNATYLRCRKGGRRAGGRGPKAGTERAGEQQSSLGLSPFSEIYVARSSTS